MKDSSNGRLDSLLSDGIKRHREGKVAEAKNLYQKVLSLRPKHADALHLLGLVLCEEELWADAKKCIEKAIALAPEVASYHNSLGELFRRQGQFRESLLCYKKAIAISRRYWEAYGNLASALLEIGEYSDCEERLNEAKAIHSRASSLYITEGQLHLKQGRYSEAEESLQSAIELAPKSWEAYNNLAVVLRLSGKSRESLEAATMAYRSNPKSAICLNTLGHSLLSVGRWKDALTSFGKGLEQDPDSIDLLLALGDLYRRLKTYDKSEEALLKAYSIDPENSDVIYSVASLYADQARYTEAKRYLRLLSKLDTRSRLLEATMARECGEIEKACAIQSEIAYGENLAKAWHSYLFSLNYRCDMNPDSIRGEYDAWASRQAKELKRHVYRNRSSLAGRRLRVALISGDWRGHPVAQFTEPILRHLNRDRFELFCLSCCKYDSERTRELRLLPEHWIDVGTASDEELADRIYRNQIDIAVDLMGHSSETKLLALARQPAPVQIGYLGYPNTTGLKETQYRLTDALADPPGMTEAHHSETLYRLPNCAWCFAPWANAPDVAQRSVGNAGEVVFGCFNNFSKLSPMVVDLWIRILQALPKARLSLKARPLLDEQVRNRFLQGFVDKGIARERLAFHGWARGLREHLESYHAIDVALDSFPYHGTTTTCEALYMGVPVVTLAGSTHHSRVGASLLGAVGLDSQCVAKNANEYVEKATALAMDGESLKALQKGLRGAMKKSPLLDQSGFVRRFERALWDIWERERPRFER